MHSIALSVERSGKGELNKTDIKLLHNLSCRSIRGRQSLSRVEPDINVSVVAQLGQARLDRALDDLAVEQRRDLPEHLGDVELDTGHFVLGRADQHRAHAAAQHVFMDDGV